MASSPITNGPQSLFTSEAYEHSIFSLHTHPNSGVLSSNQNCPELCLWDSRLSLACISKLFQIPPANQI
jgi:hypothetical protein